VFHSEQISIFFIAALLLNLAPGNDMIYVASRTVSQGTRAGMISALGVFAGCLVHIFAAVLGLSIIIARSAALFEAVKLAGAAYLVYLGIRAVLRKTEIREGTNSLPATGSMKLFKQGAATNILNPKVAVFFLSFLPQFVNTGLSSVKLQLLTLGLWFDVQGTIVLIIVAYLIGRTTGFLKKNPRILVVQEKVTGFVLVGLGLKMAFSSNR